MSRQTIVAAVTIPIAVAIVYLSRLDRVAGQVVDDAWYILLAQGLAHGQGFRLTSSATTEILPAVPPGFPAILAPIFWVSPHFPDNVLLLKSVSIAAMVGVGLTSWWYVVRCRDWPWQLGLALSVATIITPAFVFLATSTVMAECAFTFGQMATVICLDRGCAADRTPALRHVVVAAILAAAATLIRSAGVAVLAACGLYLLKERRWRHALVFSAVASICLVPWLLYARAHAPTPVQRFEHGGSIAYQYSDAIRLRGGGVPAAGGATFRDVGTRVVENLFDVFGRDAAGILVPAFLRGPDESGQEVVSLGGAIGFRAGSMGNAAATMIISLVLGVIAAIGYIRAARERIGVPEVLVPVTLAMVVLVPFWTYRYVLPLTPFLFFYVLQAVRTASADRWRLARVLILCLIGFDLSDHARYSFDLHDAARADAVEWVADAREVDGVLDWMRDNLDQDGYVATSNPALVFLETGRKTVAIGDCEEKREMWKAHGIRYVVSLRPLDLPDQASCGPYRVLHRSAKRHLWVIEI